MASFVQLVMPGLLLIVMCGQLMTVNGQVGGAPNLTQTVRDTNGVLAMALLRDELFVTRHEFRTVSVYNATSLELIRSIANRVFGDSLRGLATDQVNNCLYVSDERNDKVHRVDLRTGIITSWTVQHAAGLAVNRKHEVLAVGWFRLIRKYNSSGTLLKTTSQNSIAGIWQAIPTRNRTLIFSHFHPKHGVTELTNDGHVLRSYGNQPGSGEGQMNHPRSLAVDSNGYILVADADNNRILVVNPSLTAARTLPLNIEINSPYALCYDESRGRLYVGEYSGQGRVLVFGRRSADFGLVNRHIG